MQRKHSHQILLSCQPLNCKEDGDFLGPMSPMRTWLHHSCCISRFILFCKEDIFVSCIHVKCLFFAELKITGLVLLPPALHSPSSVPSNQDLFLKILRKIFFSTPPRCRKFPIFWLWLLDETPQQSM